MNPKEYIQASLKKLGLKPSKGLGQHFLIHEGDYRKIIETLDIKPGETIVEVGPGIGTLTRFLAESGAKIIAIEKDRKLIDFLKETLAAYPNVTIIEGDILDWQPSNHGLKDGEYKVAGNIPYYITSKIIRMALEDWPTAQKIVFMVQKEVAQRIVARPPDMSLLAVSVQFYAQAKLIQKVSAGHFQPPPDVDSAIIELRPHDKKTLTISADAFFRVAKAGFSEKRKQLANNLGRELHIAKEAIAETLIKAGIDPKRRAETLTVEEWTRLAGTL